MNVNNVIRPPKRFNTSYLSQLNIQSYGKDNLYPQRMSDLIQNSPTGGTCLERYQTFIEGNGLKDKVFSEYVCNRRGETIDDIFSLIAQDIAKFNGFSLHINYNAACEIVEVLHVPFENCRLEEEDDSGSVTYINVHPDWEGNKTRKGRKIMVDRINVKKYFSFNPIPKVVMSQIESCGGIEHYSGQILWVSLDGKNTYPKPIYDKVVTNLSTDEGLDNVKYRNVRNGFMLAGMFVHKKSTFYDFDDNGNPHEKKSDYDFSQSLDAFQGDSNTCSIMEIELNSEEDKPEFINVEGTNYDAKFTCTEASVTERIYSAFGQEPWYCIRIGKLGFSGEVLSEAYEYYNSYVQKQRRAISRVLKRIFDNWYEDANPSKDYEIEPLLYISNKAAEAEVVNPTTNSNATLNNDR